MILVSNGLLKCHVNRSIETGLDKALRKWGAGCELRGEVRHLQFENCRRDNTIHHSDVERLFCRNDASSERYLASPGQANQTREQPRSPKVHRQSAFDEDLRETRTVRRNNNVASERQIHSCSNGYAIYRRYRGLWQAMQRHGSAAGLIHVLAADRRTAQVVKFIKIEVSARAELITGTADDDNSLFRVGKLIEGSRNLIPAGAGNGVLALWLVQGEPTDGTVVTNQDKVVHRLDNTEQLRCGAVGFNPFRQQNKTKTDVVVVVTFIVITLLVVLWALLGG